MSFDTKSAPLPAAAGLMTSAAAANAFSTESNNPTVTSSNKLLQYQLLKDVVNNASDLKGLGTGASGADKTKLVAAIDRMMMSNLKYELATISLIDANPQFRRIIGDDPAKIEQFSNLLRAKAIEKEIDDMVKETVEKVVDVEAGAGKLLSDGKAFA